MAIGKGKLLEQLRAVCTEIAEKNETELVDVAFEKENNVRFLRVYIDRRGGVGLDDCEKVSNDISDYLDSADPIEENYTLEVASPGLDRPLREQRDFDRYIGETVEIKLRQAVDHKSKFVGELTAFKEQKVYITVKGEEMSFDLENIKSAKRTIIF